MARHDGLEAVSGGCCVGSARELAVQDVGR